MPTTVEIPEVGEVEFPDSMSDGQITDAIKTKILPQKRSATGYFESSLTPTSIGAKVGEAIDKALPEDAMMREQLRTEKGIQAKVAAVPQPEMGLGKLIDIPRITTAELKSILGDKITVPMGTQFVHVDTGVVAGLMNVGSSFAEFGTSPIGMATAGLGSAGGIASKLVMGGFALQSLYDAPGLARETYDALASRDPRRITEAIANDAVAAGMILGGAHVLRRSPPGSPAELAGRQIEGEVKRSSEYQKSDEYRARVDEIARGALEPKPEAPAVAPLGTSPEFMTPRAWVKGTSERMKGKQVELPPIAGPKTEAESAKTLIQDAAVLAPDMKASIAEASKSEKGVPDAVQERSAETPVVEPTPRSGEEVGQGVPEPKATAVPRQAEAQGEITPAETPTVTPAIQTPEGRVVTGKDHVAAYETAKATGTPDTSGSREGFVDETGKFISREQAAAETGLPTKTEPGKLHSSDIPEAPLSGVVEKLPYTKVGERLMITPRTDGMVTLGDANGNRIGTFKTVDEAAKAAHDMGYSIAPGSPLKPTPPPCQSVQERKV